MLYPHFRVCIGALMLMSAAPSAAIAQSTYLLQWGSHGVGYGQFQAPYGAATGLGGDVYVADQSNQRIQKFSGAGAYLLQWGSKGIGHGEFNPPTGIATDPSGNVYVTDQLNHRIQKFD